MVPKMKQENLGLKNDPSNKEKRMPKDQRRKAKSRKRRKKKNKLKKRRENQGG